VERALAYTAGSPPMPYLLQQTGPESTL
jgi:hypothetical protein